MSKSMYGLLVILTTALMGSSFAIGKIGLLYASPLLLVSFRFILAGVIMTIAVILLKKPHPKGRIQWLQVATIGFFQTAGVMGCIFVGLRTITAGESSILTFTNPLLVVILGTIFLKSGYSKRQWLGVILGFMGVFVTFGAQLDIKIGTLLGLLSAVSWAIGTLLIKTWGPKINIWVLSAYQMFIGGLILLLASFLLENPFFDTTLNSLFILIWLAVMASVIQFTLWFYLLQIGDPGKTSAFLFLAPFFGVLTGWILLDEQLKWYVATGGLLIFIGIFLVNWSGSFKNFNGKEKRNVS